MEPDPDENFCVAEFGGFWNTGLNVKVISYRRVLDSLAGQVKLSAQNKALAQAFPAPAAGCRAGKSRAVFAPLIGPILIDAWLIDAWLIDAWLIYAWLIGAKRGAGTPDQADCCRTQHCER